MFKTDWASVNHVTFCTDWFVLTTFTAFATLTAFAAFAALTIAAANFPRFAS
jgi:hypothetical protein